LTGDEDNSVIAAYAKRERTALAAAFSNHSADSIK
jgi:hypothetical protein